MNSVSNVSQKRWNLWLSALEIFHNNSCLLESRGVRYLDTFTSSPVTSRVELIAHCYICDFTLISYFLGHDCLRLFGLLTMSSISCCVLCFYAFVLMYDIGIKFDMIWYDMIWYDMIWYDKKPFSTFNLLQVSIHETIQEVELRQCRTVHWGKVFVLRRLTLYYLESGRSSRSTLTLSST